MTLTDPIRGLKTLGQNKELKDSWSLEEIFYNSDTLNI